MPRISQLSPSEKEFLSARISRSVSNGWSQQRQTIELLLYLADEKPSTEFTQVYPAEVVPDSNTVPDEWFTRLITAFKLPHERIVRPLNDELVVVYYECLPSEDAPLPPVTGEGDTFHRDWGNHYGYPKSAITAFINDESLRYMSDSDDRKTLYEIAESISIGRNDVAKLPLVSFLPSRTPSGLQEAVEVAVTHEQTLHEIAETQNIPGIRPLVTSVITNQPRP